MRSSVTWRSGTFSTVIESTCGNELIFPRIYYAGTGTESWITGGFPPHVVYMPEDGGPSSTYPAYSGVLDIADPADIGLASKVLAGARVFRLNISPFFAPYPGTLAFEGGGGCDYKVRFEKSKCLASRGGGALSAIEAPRLTFPLVSSTSLVLPRGAWAISAIANGVTVLVNQGNSTLAFAMSTSGQPYPLGALSQGALTRQGGTDVTNVSVWLIL